MQLLSRFFRKPSADNTDDKIVGTSATTASTACQNEIGPCVDTLHSANTPSQVQAAKRRFDELSILNDGQETGSTATDQSTKKPRGRPRSLVPAPAATRPQGRPRKTEEEKKEAAIAKCERAAQQAAERELDDERARQLKEAERARLEAERAPQRQRILDEQSQRMQFPPAKVYTTQTTLNFAPATTSPQTPFPDGSSPIPSASDASVSTNSTSRSIPTSVGSALPDDSDSFHSDPHSNMSEASVNPAMRNLHTAHPRTSTPREPIITDDDALLCDGGGGDPFDGDEEDDEGGSTKAQGRWEHPAWLTDLYNSHREKIKHANGSGANRSSKPFHQMLHGWLPTKTIWSRFYDTRCTQQNLKIFDPPFFYWDPLMLLGQPEDQPAGSGLVCDKCQQTESTLKKGVLRRDGFLGRPRRACDLNNSVFLIGVSYRCNNKQCNKRYRSWSPEVLNQLSSSLHSMFPFHLSHRCAITSVVWNLMRGVFQFGLGSKQFANLLVTAHRAAHDRLEVDYRSAILAREAGLPSTSLYPALGDWEDPTGNCGHVPNSQVLQEFYDSVMKTQETLLSHAESLKPCKIMTIDHSYKVPKQIAKVEGVPPFIALLMVGSEYGEVRAHVLTSTKGHSAFETSLEAMTKHLKLYGNEAPSICYTDQPDTDGPFLRSKIPSLAPRVQSHSGFEYDILKLPPGTTPILVQTAYYLTCLMKLMADNVRPEGKLVVGVDAEWATLPPGAGQQARQQ